MCQPTWIRKRSPFFRMDLDPPQYIQLDKFSASIISAPHHSPGWMLPCSEQPNNCVHGAVFRTLWTTWFLQQKLLVAALQQRPLRTTYLVILFHSFPRIALAGLPADSPTATVPSTALHKETAWKEDRVGQLQLLSYVYWIIPGSATVTLDIIVEPVQVNCKKCTHCVSKCTAVSKTLSMCFGKWVGRFSDNLLTWRFNMSLGSQLLF